MGGKNRFSPSQLLTALGVSHHEALRDLCDRLEGDVAPAHGSLVLWWEKQWVGLRPDQVATIPERGEKQGLPEWAANLQPLPESFMELARKHWNPGLDMRRKFPKVWLRGWAPFLSDSPVLKLEVGRTDFATSEALARAYEAAASEAGKNCTLKDAYFRREFSYKTDLPGQIVVHVAVATKDGHLMMAQRHPGVSTAGNCYSVSCEERWDPTKHDRPELVVMDCLEGELGLVAARAVSADSVRLMALVREWGPAWETGLVYVAKLLLTHDEVLRQWEVAEDQEEHRGIAALNLESMDVRGALLAAVRSGKVSRDLLGLAKKRGDLSEERLHEATGALRIVLALTQRFGLDFVCREAGIG